MKTILAAAFLEIGFLIAGLGLAGCSGPFAVVAGRRDKEPAVVDLQKALPGCRTAPSWT
jgi:hypothetical protein